MSDLTPYTLSTWVFMLHVNGERSVDPAVVAACDAILAASDETTGNAAGEALVDAVKNRLEGSDPAAMLHAGRSLFGDRVKSDLGQGDRGARNTHIRKYQFSRNLPWLARIWERQGDTVAPSWLLVERVTDEVRAADPNPWNDIDEERVLPVADFHVLWELDGCTAVHLA